jgi:hypothetical protein
MSFLYLVSTAADGFSGHLSYFMRWCIRPQTLAFKYVKR